MKLPITNWALDYSSTVKVPNLQRFDLFITGGPAVPVPAVPQPFFYCSWAEMLKGNAQRVSADTGVAILGENKKWGTCFMDCGEPRWADYLLSSVIIPGKAAGYKGVFLDTFDGMEDCANALGYGDPSPERTRLYLGSLNFVRRLCDLGDLKVITNRGFPQCVMGMASFPCYAGMMIESAWQSTGGPTPQSERQWIWEQLASFDTSGMTILTLDYCQDQDKAGQICQRSEARGFTPLVVRGSLTPPKIVAYPK